MARIPEADIARLKTEVSLLRLVESAGLTPHKQGKDYACRCPFHEDATASLIITPDKNLFHCFGCGEAGSPIDWVMKFNGVSFRHAAELLREGLPLAAGSSPVRHSTVRVLPPPVSRDADDRQLLLQVVDYYHATLKQSPEALAYLAQRGLDHPELIETFRLGYANRTLGLRLPDKRRQAGADVRGRLQQLGIYRASGHEHFNGSLVVPVFSSSGEVLEMYGRKLLDNLRTGTPKHLYLPGPHAGLWNEHGLAGQQEVILTEALLDAMTFWCAGYRNVTASYGTQGFTDDHLTAFKACGVERVLLAYDRDSAGEHAVTELAPRLQAAGFSVYQIRFPQGMDANDYALKVPPASRSLGQLIRKAHWLGQGNAPSRVSSPAVVLDVPAMYRSPEDAVASSADITSAPAALPAAVCAPAPVSEPDTDVSEQEVVMRFGVGETQRRWRVRGLPKNLAVGVLKVNLMVSTQQDFHVDTLDVYAARARTVFIQQAADELHLPEPLLKTELGRVLLRLEQVQDDAIRQALSPKAPPEVALSHDEQQAALALLRTPDLLSRILADVDACGIVGEATNKLTAYLAATSRKLARPLAVVVQSSSAAGKSSLMDAVLAFMPPEETVRYSAMSGQSLFYMGETNLKHKVLAIAEEEGASRASYALKLLQSEGELTMASTGTDANGNLVTQEYRVEGPMSLFMTTTAIDVDEELMNRCLVLSVDEGREQTAAIHQRQRARRTLAGLQDKTRREALLTLHRNAQRLLRPLSVVNPYAGQLTFRDDQTRTRRDHEKYLSLIDTIALLHQHQRPLHTLQQDGQRVEYIEVTADDIAQANRLAHDVLGHSLDELPPQTRKLLALLCDWVNTQAAAHGMARSEVRFSRKTVRDALGVGDTQLKIHLARLAELEYLLVHRARQGQLYVYELLYDGDGRQPRYLSGLTDPTALRYDVPRSEPTTAQSDASRPDVGGWPGDGQPQSTSVNPQPTRDGAEDGPLLSPTRPLNRATALHPNDITHQSVATGGSYAT